MTAAVVAAAGVAVSLFVLGDPVAAEHQRAVIWQYAAIRQSVQALSLDSRGEYNHRDLRSSSNLNVFYL